MNTSEAQELINTVGGTEQAMSIVYDGLQPFETQFKWWDVEQNDFCLISISEHSVYTPNLQKALKKLKLV